MSHVFISYTHKDQEFVERLYADLKVNKIDVWADFDILPGEEWFPAIQIALENAVALILVLSPASLASRYVETNWLQALSQNKQIIPIIIGGLSHKAIPFGLTGLQFIDFRDSYEFGLSKLLGALKSRWSHESTEPPPRERNFEQSDTVPKLANKGYAFLSYTSEDADFVDHLRGFLETRKYIFWDYRGSERDYTVELYRELETRIEEAALFISVLSDSWRKTLWPAREYVYAEEAKKNVFVVQAKPLEHPVPILLNLHTRIDMSKDFDAGIRKLAKEFDKRGL